MTEPRTKPQFFFGSREGNLRVALFATGVTVICTVFFLFFDKDIALAVRHGLSKDLRNGFLPITNLGKADGYIIAALACWLFGRVFFLRAAPLAVARAWYALSRLGSFILVSLGISAVLVHTLKLSVGRARPKALFREDFYGLKPLAFDFDLNSFPSGHSQTVWTVMTVLIILFPRGWPLFVTWAGGISVSRVIVGAHYPSDVLMGSFIAVMSVIYVRQRWYGDLEAPAFGRYIKRNGKEA